jgi:hypothetical protein
VDVKYLCVRVSYSSNMLLVVRDSEHVDLRVGVFDYPGAFFPARFPETNFVVVARGGQNNCGHGPFSELVL